MIQARRNFGVRGNSSNSQTFPRSRPGGYLMSNNFVPRFVSLVTLWRIQSCHDFKLPITIIYIYRSLIPDPIERSQKVPLRSTDRFKHTHNHISSQPKHLISVRFDRKLLYSWVFLTPTKFKILVTKFRGENVLSGSFGGTCRRVGTYPGLLGKSRIRREKKSCE